MSTDNDQAKTAFELMDRTARAAYNVELAMFLVSNLQNDYFAYYPLEDEAVKKIEVHYLNIQRTLHTIGYIGDKVQEDIMEISDELRELSKRA